MEAASRPPLEALPDLPVEAPLDSAKAPAGAAAAPGGPSAPAETAKPKDPEQTGLNFIDPEMFLGQGQPATAVPVLNAAGPASKPAEPELELVLEDPVVDDMLTAPPPPPPPAAAPRPEAAASAAPKATPAESGADAAAARAAARVPIAKTASLSAAATKLAAASGVSRPSAKPAPAPKPQTTPPAAPPANAEAAKAAAPVVKGAAPTAPKADTPAATLDAPSLASWASARAAAAQKVRPAAASAGAAAVSSHGAATAMKSSAARSAASAPPPPPPAAAAQPAAPPPSSSSVAAAPVMDRDFIARNQIVERYLSGRLPLKAATEFERYCRAHGELLDELGLPERVNAGLRLLEASGKPEPWQEAPRPVWQKPQVTLVLAAAVALLAVTLAGIAASNSSKSHRIAELQKQNAERALDPATSTREIRLLPSRSGASNSPAITIGGGAGGAQLADLKIDESRSPFHTFRITIDRIDQGRVAIINNIDKDSNGHLRIALNSSALGPGNYQLTLEGLDWRGQPQPDSWVTIGIVR